MSDDAGSRGMKVTALAGGVGGARLLHGLDGALAAGQLTAVVNTGDDFIHWGLHIAPDLDTVMYTLAGLSHQERGWGLAEESFSALEMVRRFGGDDWFQLGDRDLATHILRTAALREGQSLSRVTERLCRALELRTRILPMSDASRPTMIETRDDGTLPFQDWLVGMRGEPEVTQVLFEGPTEPAPAVIEAIEAAELIVLCPSNPYVSIDPILALRGVRDALRGRPVIALSPIVAGRAVKGPLAGMIRSVGGAAPSAAAIASHYGDLVDAMVVEEGDEEGIALPTLATSTVMGGLDDRVRLARELLDFGERLR